MTLPDAAGPDAVDPDAVDPDAADNDGGDAPDVGPFEKGFLIGVLVGEGSFGGDGKQPQVTLRMHTDHERLFEWITAHFPGGKLYGPYHHGGRSYYQWMARGAFLRDVLVPMLNEHFSPDMDGRVYLSFQRMKSEYAQQLSNPLREIDAKLRRMDEEG